MGCGVGDPPNAKTIKKTKKFGGLKNIHLITKSLCDIIFLDFHSKKFKNTRNRGR
jgi:hypothetical protein